jgi:hypothetical protein
MSNCKCKQLLNLEINNNNKKPSQSSAPILEKKPAELIFLRKELSFSNFTPAYGITQNNFEHTIYILHPDFRTCPVGKQ